MLRKQYDYNCFILWSLADHYINDEFKNTQCLFSRKVNFMLNTILHGAFQVKFLYNFTWNEQCIMVLEHLFLTDDRSYVHILPK